MQGENLKPKQVAKNDTDDEQIPRKGENEHPGGVATSQAVEGREKVGRFRQVRCPLGFIQTPGSENLETGRCS